MEDRQALRADPGTHTSGSETLTCRPADMPTCLQHPTGPHLVAFGIIWREEEVSQTVVYRPKE